jgi:alpha-beta hydrolase superfamily lysophospholipase
MSDGYTVRGRVWLPARSAPSRAVIYLHGIQSHGGWFEWSASLIAKQGCPVILPDRRGSGMNETARGDTPSADRWLLDLDELATWARREFSVTRFGVVGVSWGGKPAVAWTLRQPEMVSHLLLIGPGLFPAVEVGLVTRFQIGRSLLTRAHKTFAIPLDDPALFTDNPAGREFIAHDPLRLSRATARFFWHSRGLDRRLLRAARGSLEARTLLVLAGADRIIRNPPIKTWILRIAGERARVETVPGAAHTLEFASDGARFGGLVENWATEALQVAK